MAPIFGSMLAMRSTTTTPSTAQYNSNTLRRRWSGCSYYDTGCDSQRNIMLGIFISIGVLMIIGFTICMVIHRRKGYKVQTVQTNGGVAYQISSKTEPARWYYPGFRGLAAGPLVDVQAPPPAYTRTPRSFPGMATQPSTKVEET